MAEASTSHGSTPGWSENPIYGIKGGEKPHPVFRDLNFNRYIWCLSADATRGKWWLGAVGPIETPFKPPTETKDFQYKHRILFSLETVHARNMRKVQHPMFLSCMDRA